MESQQLPPHGSVGKAELDVPLHAPQQGAEGHLLDRLRGGSVKLPGDVEPLVEGSIPSLIVA
jgi:hypothetical protein